MVKLHNYYAEKILFRIFKAFFSSILQKYHHWVYSVPDKLIVKVGKGLPYRQVLSQFISAELMQHQSTTYIYTGGSLNLAA